MKILEFLIMKIDDNIQRTTSSMKDGFKFMLLLQETEFLSPFASQVFAVHTSVNNL